MYSTGYTNENKSILLSIKSLIGLYDDNVEFDGQIIADINGVFWTLHDIGIGPSEGFSIIDETAKWSDFLSGDDKKLNAVLTYMYLKVKLLFDPPSNSYLVDLMSRQASEVECRLRDYSDIEGLIG